MLPTGTPWNIRVVVCPPLVEVMLVEPLPWSTKDWLVLPTVRPEVVLTLLVVMPELKVLLAVKVLVALSKATLALRRESLRVPLAMFVALRLVSSDALRAGKKPAAVS